MTLYDRVAAAAKNAGMTIAALERAAGLSKGTISKWRVVDPQVGNLVRVAKVLNVDINDLIGGVDNAENVAAGKER